MSAFNDLANVLELVKDLRLPGQTTSQRAELLKRIAEKLLPYIEAISEPVSLSWGLAVSNDEYISFHPESEFTIDQLSSQKGILLWSPSTRKTIDGKLTGDQLWLLSSGKFLYIKGKHSYDRGIGWSSESWVGLPFESYDPAQLSLPSDMKEICDAILDAIDRI